jgi:hypothetical protein
VKGLILLMRASFPLTAERGRIRAVVAALCAVAAMAAVAAVAPPAAHAAFTIGRCEGAPIEGQGSSAQKEAQLEFWSTTVFHGVEGCGASAPHVEYKGNGSGCGIASIGGAASSIECLGFTAAESKPGFRAPSTRYAGSDAPLTVTQQLAADAAGGTKPGVIHQIPVASFAVAIIVHFPEGCKLKDPGSGAASNGTVGSLNGDTSTGGPNDPPGGETGDKASEETLRVHIEASEMETIWDGTSQTWGNIVPEADLEGEGKTAKECAEVPVIRIARFDGSGTTYNFKAYLSLLPGAPAGLWTEAPVAGDNSTWPETFNSEKKKPEAVTITEPVGKKTFECKSSNHICTAAAEGGGPLTEAVAGVNGSIGYADLATSRKHGFYMEKNKKDHTYWIPMQTVSPEKGNEVGVGYAEPSEVATSNLVASPEGANCTDADYRGFPTEGADPTLGDWEKSIATGSTASAIKNEPVHAYPICALTYDFAWDDDAPVYGESLEEQEKARTVKDYLEGVESTKGQFQLALHDYGTLPLSIVQIAQNGVKAIDWNKSAGSGKGSEEVVKPPESKTPTVTTTTTTTVVTPPSNVFSVAGTKIKGKSVVLSLVLPGAGRVQIKAVGGGVTVANVSASVGGGQGTVTLPISSAAVKKLAKVKGHRLSVKITVTFTPTGGAAASKTKTITITQAAITAKKKTKKGKKKG